MLACLPARVLTFAACHVFGLQSGRSFANLLQPNGSATAEQESRMQFALVSSGKPEQCPPITRLMSRLLPTLRPDRCVRTQDITC
jgi:hypothetical protein